MYNLRGAPYNPLPAEADASMIDKMDTIMSGKWTVEDVLEMGIDEISTAAGVGSGTQKPLGSGSYKDNRLEKMRKAYEEYLSKTKKDSSIQVMSEFLERTIPGAEEDLAGEFFQHLRKEGFEI